MLNRYFFIFCFLFSCQISFSQQVDTTPVVLLDSTLVESVKKKKKKKFFLKGILKEPYPSARKAALLSFMLPGAGQAYNKKYWKVPIVYAGIGSLVYAIRWNGREYRKFRDAYKYRVDDLVCTVDRYEGFIEAQGLKDLRDFHFKNYQLSYIGFGVVYLLNSVEAFVDAHLLDFDVNEDLSIQLSPTSQIMHDGSTTFSLGVSLVEKREEVVVHPGF